MSIFKLFTFFSIIIYTSYGGNVNSKIDLVNSVLDNFHCHSVIFLSIGTNNDINYIKRFNTYNSGGNVYYGLSITLSTFWKADKSSYIGSKRTVVVIEVNDRSIISLLERMTKEFDISPFVWLVITQTLTTRDFENLTIPLSSEFIIAKENDLGFNLSELYNVDERKKLRKDVGILHHKSDVPGNRQVTVSAENFYRRRKNLEGGTIRVISPLEDPCFFSNFGKGIYLLVQCINMAYWNTMAEFLNATTEIIVDPGLNLSSIVTADADLTLRSAPMNSFDLSTRSYLWAIYPEKIRLVARLIGQNVGWKTYINPFDNYMWAAILIWIIFCELILITAEFITVKDKDRDKPFLNYHRKYSFLSFFAFCNQADSGEPIILSYRLVHFLIFLVPAFLIPGYEAVLRSFLTVELPKMPFRTLDELSRSENYRLGWHGTLPLRNLFNEKNTSEMFQKILHSLALPEEELPATDFEAAERMCDENFAYLLSLHTMFALNPKCKLYVIDEHFVQLFTTMEVKKDSMYLFLMNRCVMLLEFSGISNRIKTSIVYKLVPHETDTNIPLEKLHINLENTVLPFVILFTGMIISFLILSLEKLRFRFSTGNDSPARRNPAERSWTC